jgi:predicted nucleic acid-binding protein
MNVITNTTVLSNFAAIGQLDLLRQLYGTIYIPTEVYEEIRGGLEEGYRFYAGIDQLIHPFVEEGWIRLTGVTDEPELRFLGELPRRLHQGEAACLAIAQHRDWMLLTDDLAARREATGLGIRKSGSVGCLVLAVERGLCTLEQANLWLEDMIRRNYRSPVTDLTPLLKRSD